MGRSRWWEAFLGDWVMLTLTTPGLVFALVCAMIFGLGALGPIVAVVVTSISYVAVNVVEGVKALALAPAFNAQLDPTAQAVLNLANNSSARQGINDLTQFNNTLGPPLAFVTPAQSVCNYATLLFRNLASFLGSSDGIGTSQRFIVLQPAIGPSSEIGPSSAPANGGGQAANFLHYNPYPNTASPGQTRECESGNEGYPAGLAIGNVPGNQGLMPESITKPNKLVGGTE